VQHLPQLYPGRTKAVRIHLHRSWSIEIGKVQKVEKSSSERNFSENGAHFQNLDLGHSWATEFSWTSRSHHPNRYISKPTWEGFRANLTTGERAISIFVKIFLEKRHSIFTTICPPIVL
jgi:hypothetical protein